MNGWLYLHAPIASYPQRGKLHLDFHLSYNNQMFTSFKVCLQVCTTIWEWRGTGLQIVPDVDYALGEVYDNGGTNIADYVATASDGSSHMMGTANSSHNWLALDGTGFQYDSTANVLIDGDGVRYSGGGVAADFYP